MTGSYNQAVHCSMPVFFAPSPIPSVNKPGSYCFSPLPPQFYPAFYGNSLPPQQPPPEVHNAKNDENITDNESKTETQHDANAEHYESASICFGGMPVAPHGYVMAPFPGYPENSGKNTKKSLNTKKIKKSEPEKESAILLPY